MMKRFLFLMLFFTCIFLHVHAQFNITGQLIDPQDEPVNSAMVMLLSAKDSTLINYTTSDSKGFFTFKNIKKSYYLLKISHITYMPQTILIEPDEEKELNLNALVLKPIASFLMEVVIKEAKAPIYIKGDTVEYDATTFKVPPGSTVEDLLRKLPGIDVDAEGNISTMGKNVKTVYVDGKTFFGNDPKTVTQNLDAQAVSKVQVFTEKSEQEKLTGISDGSKEKVMNLELKEEYKKGYFGKASLGYGWGQNAPHRWLAKGSFNWFTDKQQLSFIGFGNNLNQSNYDWNDMQEFRGQSIQAGNDDGDFGFSSSHGMRFISYSSSGPEGSGFSNNGGGGINYNYYNKKLKYNAGYLYTVNKTFSDVFTNRKTFLEDSMFHRLDTTHNNNLKQNHNFSTRFEYQIDSLNNIIVRANFGYLPNKRSLIANQLFQTDMFMDINKNSMDNHYTNDDYNFDVLSIYNHKFKKKGRSFSISGFFNYKDGRNTDSINNENHFFNPNEVIKYIVKNCNSSEDLTVKSSILYVEPLGKRLSLLGFYNFRNTNGYKRNDSFDPLNEEAWIDSLDVEYHNKVLYNRVGTSLNYGHNGINLTAGGAYQSLILKGTLNKPPIHTHLPVTPYHNFIPYFSAWFQLPKNIYLRTSYSYNISEPDISYLFPMPNLSNTLYKILGNPALKPERYHGIDGSFNYWNSASMMNLYWSANANFYENQIVYNQKIEFVDKQGYVTTSEPNNVKGGNSFGTHLWTSIPIVKTVLTMSFSGSGNISNSPVFINSVENITNSKSYNVNTWFTVTVKQKLTFYVGGNVSQNFTKYSIQTDRNQNYINYGVYCNIKWQFLKKTYLESSYGFYNYTNKKLDFSRDLHKLNISIRQVIGKKNQWEMRLAAVDILNSNQFISQIARLNYIEYRTAPTIARYFFLTVSYNLKGFEVKNTGNQKTRIMR